MFTVEIPADLNLVEPIERELNDWVRCEAATSLDDRNAYLDDLKRARTEFSLPLDDPMNYQAAKYRSHHDRQYPWGETLILEPLNDFVSARHLFNILMGMSGSARRAHYFAARDQADYLARKTQSIIPGLDLLGPIKQAIDNFRGPVNHLVVPDPEIVQALTLQTFEQAGAVLEELHARAPLDFGLEESPAQEALGWLHARWAQMATISILMAMGYRGGSLAAVPFLEPKSISDDPKVIYPFAAKVA